MTKKNQIDMIRQAQEAGEPTFTFRAQDLFSLYCIGNYILLLESYPEATNPGAYCRSKGNIPGVCGLERSKREPG